MRLKPSTWSSDNVGQGDRLPENYSIEKTRNGDATLAADGKYLHSRFDPLKEARRSAERVPKSVSVVVLGGFGLGYVAWALLEQSPDRRLIIADADPRIPGVVRGRQIPDEVLGNPLVSLLAGGSPSDISELLRGGPAGAEVYYLDWKPSTDLAPDWYTELSNILEETIRRREVNARTLERFGPLWVRNLASNVGAIADAVSLEPWEGRFKGIPALILAGGPSLETLLPWLEKLSDSHLIICVDTALPAALKAGARIDVVAAVDPQYWNTRHLDRCREAAGDALVLAESATHPAVFRKLSGRPWLTRTRFPLGTLLEDAAGIKGELKAGGSVATAAWDLARHLGCEPMTVAGLDLGFPGGRTHYAGSLARRLPLLWSSRTAPAEDWYFHALHDAGARPVAAFDGGEVLSDRRMDVYAAWFSESAGKVADRRPSVVGNSGRRIEGLGHVPVSYLTSFPSIRDRKESLLDRVKESGGTADNLQAIRRRVADICESLDRLEDASLEGIEQIRRERDGKGPGIQSTLAALDEIDRRILEGDGKEVVSFLIQPIILEITSGPDGGDPLETSMKLYREMADSAAYHLKHLRRLTRG